jgi:ABC-type methionine transport system ATPase subunit
MVGSKQLGKSMSEEILKIELVELLKTVRLKKSNGIVLEASDMEAVRDICSQIRGENAHAGQLLSDFFNAASKLTDAQFPIAVEFAVTMEDRPDGK